MQVFNEALAALGLSEVVRVLPVSSGYPSPKQVNLVLFRREETWLFESSAATSEIVAEIEGALDAHSVQRLDALLVTHCHGDHAGSAGIIAGRGRPPGERAPIYLHSAGYRFLTHPEAAFLQETYELFLARSHWGLLEYGALSQQDMVEHALRKRFQHYFAETPKRALRFVDRGALPEGVIAVATPGHSWDCVLYLDLRTGVAIPGDTLLVTGAPQRPDSHGFVIPIFTAAGQSYSMAFEHYLQTLRVLREFFRTRPVRVVLPPHGKFAVTEPLRWVEFAEQYFVQLYRALVTEFFGSPARRREPFFARDLAPFVPTAGAHPISTPGHAFGMLCALADEGYLGLEEHPHTRQISFTLRELPPPDYLEARLAEPPGPLPIHGER